MKYRIFKAAVGLASCALASAPAWSQSNVAIYGNLDVAVDHISKTQGNVTGTVFGLNGTTPVPNSIASPSQSVTRMTPSLSQQSFFGFKGVEDLGNGMKANFVLEGGIQLDGGTLTNDGRLFGRQAYVALTTQAGEVRLGRQASPMMIAYYLGTTDRLGSSDLMARGLVTNSLQMFQDNLLTYAAMKGPWVVLASFSPNAGVPSQISPARSVQTPTTPPSTPATGQILGGLTAGAESNDHRGRTFSAMAAYSTDELTLVGSYQRSEMRAPMGFVSTTGFVPLVKVDSYRGAMVGAKYKFAATGTVLGANFHTGTFNFEGPENPKVNTYAIGVNQPYGNWNFVASAMETKFTNFTKGKDFGAVIGFDYNLSKRSALYMRSGYVKDERGRIVRGVITPLPISGGPTALLIPLGANEIPLFAGAGTNMDARTTIVSFGMRHSF
jgi:predicted porin